MDGRIQVPKVEKGAPDSQHHRRSPLRSPNTFLEYIHKLPDASDPVSRGGRVPCRGKNVLTSGHGCSHDLGVVLATVN